MNIVFMGTPDFAIPSLRALAESKHSVSAVFTQPDRPRGRGKKMMPPPVKQLASLLGIHVSQPEKISSPEAIDALKELAPTVIVVAAYGQILPEKVLSIPSLGCINVHASLLPAYRGAAPIHRAIMNGDEYTGVTIMLMDTGMDTGDMLLKKSVPVYEDDTAGILHDRLAEEGARLLTEAMEKIEKGEIEREPQREEDASYAPPLTREDEMIDWNEDARSIKNRVRGLNPWPGARTTFEGKILKIWEVEIESSSGEIGIPGTVISAGEKEGIVVQAGDGTVRITSLQVQGKKKMSAGDFLRGYSLPKGTVLGE